MGVSVGRNSMYIKQPMDVFIREFGEIGYITSQLTKKDRVYDQTGAVFLSVLARTPRHINEMVADLYGQFLDASAVEIETDFRVFVADLKAEGFLLTGETPQEAEERDVGFTYAKQNPKTTAIRLLSQDRDNSMPRTDDLLTDYFRKNPTIFGINFEVTSNCNEHCIHCYQTRGTVHDVELDLAIDVLDQLAEMGTASITFSGGEPTLHPAFAEILRQTRSRDFMINILSNGLLLSTELMDIIREVNVNMVQISLYSMDRQIHESITRVPGSHTATLACIERLIEREVPVQVSCPMMKENRDSYQDVSHWCSEHKVRVLSDFIMLAKSDFDRTNLSHRLDLEQTRQVILDILDVDAEYPFQLEEPPKTKDPLHYAEQPVCGIGIDNVCITSDGKVFPCAGFRSFVLGSVREQKLSDIWLHSERANYLRSIQNKSFPMCLKCEARDYCAMCLVRNYNESGGDMFRVAGHFCQVAFMNKELVEVFRTHQL